MELIKLKSTKIIIIKLSAIGDVVHALPAVNIIKDKIPSAEVSWIVDKKASNVLEDHPSIDNLIVLPLSIWKENIKSNKVETFNEIINFFQNIRSFKYHYAIDLQGLFKSGLVTFLSGARYRIGYNDAREGSTLFYNKKFSPPPEGTPVVERYIQLIEKSLGIKSNKVEFNLSFSQFEKEKIDVLLIEYGIENNRRIVVINPITSWLSKNWPLNLYSLLCDRLIDEYDCQVLLTGSAANTDEIDLIIEGMKNRAFNLCGRINLRELAELYKRADVFVGGDTGPMHIASAVDCPVVTIMGPTNPVRNGPYGVKSIILQKEIDCINCWKRKCPLDHHNCMKQITVNEVFNAITSIMEVN